MRKIAYLVSRYPSVSHTFVMRELSMLRSHGLDVHTFSVRRSNPADLLTEEDRRESARTFAILPTTPLRFLRAHLTMLFTCRHRYFAALWMALSARRPGWRAALWHLFYFGEAAILAGELRRRGIDHLHVHFANVASDVAMLASRMCSCTWSITLHGLADFGDPVNSRLSAKTRSAALIICVSDYGRAQAMLHTPPEMWSKIQVVRCGVDTDRFRPDPADRADRDLKRVRLLNVGRLSPEKGHTILLRAMHQARLRGTDLSCTIVGEGPERARLERLGDELGLTDHVKLVGAVGQDKIGDYYREADIFVLPSLAEGLPVVLMEAMALGIPVIASRITGIPELVSDGVDGLLVSPGREDAFADAIIRLAEDRDLRHRMGTHGRRKVCDDFDLHANGTQLFEIFKDLLPDGATDGSYASATAAARAVRS